MRLPKIIFTVILTILTIAIVITFHQILTSLLPSRVLAQTSELAITPAASVTNIDTKNNQDNYASSEKDLQNALRGYCKDSGLSENTIFHSNTFSPTDIRHISQYCLGFDKSGSENIILSKSLSHQYPRYKLPLQMADAFRVSGDIYRNKEDYNEAIKFYQLSLEVFRYQDFFEQNKGNFCKKENKFKIFLESLYKLGISSFEIYKNVRLTDEDKELVLNLVEEALTTTLSRLPVFSYSSIFAHGYYTNLFEDTTAVAGHISESSGNLTLSLSWSASISDEYDENLRNSKMEFAEKSALQNSKNSSETSICITENLPSEIESHISGVLQQVLIEKDNFSKAVVIADAGRTLEIDKYIAHSLELARRNKEINFIKDLTLKVTPESINRIANQEQVTIINYSIVSDESLFIWTFPPGNKYYWKQVNCRQVLKEIQPEKIASQTENQCAAKLKKLIQPQSREWGRGQVVAKVEPIRGKQEDNIFYSVETLKKLHELLIQPIADFLPQDPKQHVIFVPYGPLFFAPFPALQNKSGQYLIDAHPIRVVPNLRTLVLNHNNRRHNFFENRNAIIVGNPKMPAIGTKKEELIALPWAGLEAVEVAELLRKNRFNVIRLMEEQATKTSVVQAMNDASIIHLATHGIIDSDVSNTESALDVSGQLALAPSKNNNGWLTALDLLKMRLNKTDLVVLSACDSASGKLIPGGVVGLPFSLSLAGTSSIVASIWYVPDTQGTVFLMKDFYSQILSSEGVDVAQALRQAMLNTRNWKDEKGNTPYSDPRYWAGFTLIGSAR